MTKISLLSWACEKHGGHTFNHISVIVSYFIMGQRFVATRLTIWDLFVK